MSRKTPHVWDGFLRDPEGNPTLEIGSEDWWVWLDDEQHHTFHFTDDSGGFTARKEHKQRGDVYWVAYRQVHNKLYKHYLGKTASLTLEHLQEASAALVAAVESFEHNPSGNHSQEP
jgi:LuxR family maltose regulon positive regulatory protein